MIKTYDLIKSYKDLGYTVIVGGPHATTRPEEVVQSGADIVVRNEGEETLRELCKYWNGESLNTDKEELDKKFSERIDKGLNVPQKLLEESGEGLGSILGITYYDKDRKKLFQLLQEEEYRFR